MVECGGFTWSDRLCRCNHGRGGSLGSVMLTCSMNYEGIARAGAHPEPIRHTAATGYAWGEWAVRAAYLGDEGELMLPRVAIDDRQPAVPAPSPGTRAERRQAA